MDTHPRATDVARSRLGAVKLGSAAMSKEEEDAAVDMGFSPRIRRERLAAELKALRGEQKLSAAQLAAKIGCSASRITRLESLETLPDVGFVWEILDALGVVDPKRQELLNLARDGSKRGWWRAFTSMPAQQAGRAELEVGAVTIREYTPVYAPGLLQSPKYARARFEDGDAYEHFDIEEALRGRVKRQEVLTRDDQPTKYDVIIDEAVFRRRTADDEAMREQVDHLLRIGRLANVTVRVLTFDAVTERNSRPVNAFSLYEFADPNDPQIVAVETESSDLHLGDPDDWDRYTVVYERVQAVALGPDESAQFIKGVRP